VAYKGKYLLYICNIVLMSLIIFNIFSYDIENKETSVFALDTLDGKYVSYLEIDNIKKEVLESTTIEENKNEIEIKEETQPAKKVEVKQEEPVVVTPKEEVKEEEKQEVIVDKEDITQEEKQETIIETLVGNLVGYGPDCYGCTSMKTASGKYIGEGNIYYNDATYGKIRIVAGDYSYPFGTIVRISNVDFYNDEPFYAVVLDRGGNIGKNKKFLFDLLFASEQEALALGKEINIKYEIMRLGY